MCMIAAQLCRVWSQTPTLGDVKTRHKLLHYQHIYIAVLVASENFAEKILMLNQSYT